jgi:putative ABC transport system permease protein
VLDFLRLIIRNAGRNRRRTALTIMSVGLSLFLLVCIRTLLVELGGDSMTTAESARRLLTRHSVSVHIPLPVSHKKRIQALDGVEMVSEYQWYPTYYRDRKNLILMFAVDPSMIGTDPEYRYPPGHVEAFRRDRTGVVMPKKMMERFGWRLGQRITFPGTALPFNLELTIRGVYTGPVQTIPMFHYAYFNDLVEKTMPRRGNRATSFAVRVRTVEDVPRIAAKIDRMFENSEAPTRTETEKAFITSFSAMLGNVRLFMTMIGTAVVFAIFLVTLNTMAMSTRERTTEIAVLKTLGFTRAHILALLAGESLLISLLGGAAGVAGAKILFSTLDIYDMTQGIIQHFDISRTTIGFGAGVAAAMGILSAAVPAWRAANTPIAATLSRVA